MVSKITPDGREIILTRLNGVHWFGEMSLLDGKPRTHNVTSCTDATIAVVAQSDVLQLLSTHRSIYEALVLQLCHHARMLYSGVDDLLLMRPERLLAWRVGELSRSSTDPSHIKISQDDLARLIGFSRQSVNRILRIWEDKGYIRRAYGALVILNSGAIEAISHHNAS